MSNPFFKFKQFTVHHDRCAMKVTTDACLFGAWVADTISSGSNPPKILDIGAGTALLPLMLAQKTSSTIDAIEIDADSCQQAEHNVSESPWAGRIRIVHGDAKEYPFDSLYETIISNPPFYENELSSPDEKRNTAHHSTGLLLKELLDIIKKAMTPDGQFFLLFPYKRNAEIKSLLPKHGLQISQILFVRQSVKHDYFRMMVSGKHKKDENSEMRIQEISIWNEQQTYTPDFSRLLSAYYLYL